MSSSITVAIDGTAGSGKSTLGKRLAVRLGIRYVDSGALYRAVGWAAVQKGIDLNDTAGLTSLASEIHIELKLKADSSVQVLTDGKDVTREIRTPDASKASSAVAAIQGVRDAVTQRLREMAGGGVVMDGRDIGTVVLPKADVKIFLDANPEVRAQRRMQENAGQGITEKLDKVLTDIKDRDAADSSRSAAPLVAADDAHVIDTSGYSLEELEEMLLDIVEKSATNN